ncbi:MAG: hypothetical protein JWN77_1482 [Frankiales bacterium]|nr:hypothetical protein [Frankiales bacterium]
MQQANRLDQQNEVLDALVQLQRAEARAYIARCRALVDLQTLAAPEPTSEFLVMELAGSCRLGQQAAGNQMVEAERVLDALPRMAAAMADGEFFLGQARIVLAETKACDADLLRRVDAVLMPRARELASTDLRRLVRRTVLELESADEAEARLDSARATRRVTMRPEQDGMGVVNALLTAEQLRQFQTGLAALEARQRLADRDAGLQRTADERRADLFAALPLMALTGTSEVAPPKVVFTVQVPVTTVLERGRQPGFADGYGEISAEHVRLLRPHASLRCLYVDAGTGMPVGEADGVLPPAADVDAAKRRVETMLRAVVHADVDEPQHDPSAALARLVDLRGRHCSGIGCSSTRCDRDHLDPWPAGPTAVRNLDLKSRRCHRAKHSGWSMVRHPDGSVTWTSPLGRTYGRPSPHVPPDLPPSAPPPPPRSQLPRDPEDDESGFR